MRGFAWPFFFKEFIVAVFVVVQVGIFLMSTVPMMNKNKLHLVGEQGAVYSLNGNGQVFLFCLIARLWP